MEIFNAHEIDSRKVFVVNATTTSLLRVRNSMPPFLAAFIASTLRLYSMHAYKHTLNVTQHFCFMHMYHDMHTSVSQ